MKTEAPPLVTLDEIRAAQERLAAVAVHTPLTLIEPAALAAEGIELPYRIHVKREDLQPIGSFKIRGAFNLLAQLPPYDLERGVITYSSGNHAQGVAYGARALGAKAIVVMPVSAPAIKRDATAAMGAEVVLVGTASSERRKKAEELSEKYGYTIVPPYDDARIIAGAATCGLEIIQDEPSIDCVLTPVGGGGLLSGTCTAVKLLKPDAVIFGVEPELAADAALSFAQKRVVELTGAETSRTMADGLRTQSVGSLNLLHFLRYANGVMTVTEDEILAAMRVLAKTTGVLPEPSGAVALAAALFHPERLPGVKEVAVVISGGNVDPALRDDILR